MYIYLDESRVAFHFLSSNVAGQLFEIACGQKSELYGIALNLVVAYMA